MMIQITLSTLCLTILALTQIQCSQIEYLPNSIFQDFINRIQVDRKSDSLEQQIPYNVLFDTNDKDSDNELINRYRFQTRDDILLPREPSPRKEYLEHSALFGHQYVQGGAGEGIQRLKPDGSIANIQVIKSDSVLPAYCNPPNPCPNGYTAEDGCLEEFENTADFSKEYQSSQECMCDSEHMFNCPGNNDENELETLARSIQNEGMTLDSTLDKIMTNMDKNAANHKVVAKKFFIKRSNIPIKIFKRSIGANKNKGSQSHKLNPFLVGEKLPIVAKKSPHNAKL